MVKPQPIESLASRLKLRHLQIALALRDAPSAKEVAAAANVSESAVSKTLAELESQLGFKLFERIGNAKRPTKMGRQILPMMEAVVAQSRGLAQAVTDVRSGRLGDLRIGVATDMGKLTLAPLIHAFNQAQPGVALDVQAGGYRAMADLLLDDKLDALVCYDTPELIAPGLGRLRLVPPQPLVVVANARLSPLAARRRLTLRELHAEPWCKPRPGTMMHDKLTALFLGCDLELPPRGIQVSDLLLTDEFVRTTDYLVMLPLAAALRLTVGAEAVILPVELGVQNPPTVLAWQRAAERQTPLHRFLQFCEAPQDGRPMV
ncbi:MULTISPECIES: LysR family transcriptional regulator [Achromobacter]|uniref:LysR family transcriptional regulator n=1 Tax=Alcaligenes xylosoxydans xylosoxydans TaxID=85698 RepID=A0A424WCZ7_ALCXX|nr:MULTISPECIES: LysR family transcriptional regulator [Achromobacter]MBC9903380.1 LysR family transcriptional regulator [Achromobacter xylosoxidans]MBD0867263.1 LysR family transcriptional regulator [Achromobacter xylosoxidans]MDH1304153.1 LysR family transcriptional regulator [Achromobacter sp. GD03932]QNP88291.1 LysR family transcriptional regulator [Achromobacter xylosoxidans]RPJ91124.1 LysR family transcriptional regulator [Achromobacter xylosoxidans]